MWEYRKPKSSFYNIDRSEKKLVKILIRDPVENIDDLVSLIKKYNPGSAQFFVHLNHQQIAGLKRQYGDKIAIIYGELLRNDKLDKPPKIEKGR